MCIFLLLLSCQNNKQGMADVENNYNYFSSLYVFLHKTKNIQALWTSTINKTFFYFILALINTSCVFLAIF